MRSVLGDDGFRLALVLSTIGVCAVVIVANRLAASVGFAIVVLVAAAVALRVDFHVVLRLPLALLALGFAGRPVVESRDRLIRFALLIVGALLLVSTLHGAAGWMRMLAFVGAIASVPLGAALDARIPRFLPLLLFATAVGIYACAPDTETPKILLGAIGPCMFLAIDPETRGGPPTGALLALVVWSAVLGGHGRPGAVVGSLACFGVLLLLPFVRPRWRTPEAVVTLLVVQAALVVWVSRVAGLRDGALLALVLAIPAFALAFLALWFAAGSAGQGEEHAHRRY
ncbi:MAG TPA: hypothetical protein VGN51_17955 [Acidimicrobiia bacterium]